VKLAAAPSVVVCLGAHADDIEIGAGGTIATLADRHPDTEFVFIVMSAAGERLSEAMESAERLLGDRVVCHVGSFTDGYLPYADAAGVKDFIRSAANGIAPDLVLAPHSADKHQDHRFVADLALQVFRGPLILEYEIVKFDGDLGQPNLFVPLTAEAAAFKLDHLATSFPSQHDKPWYAKEAFEALLRVRGIESQSDSGLAEAFHATKVVIG